MVHSMIFCEVVVTSIFMCFRNAYEVITLNSSRHSMWTGQTVYRTTNFMYPVMNYIYQRLGGIKHYSIMH